MRLSQTASPPVQPSCSSTSGTGSVRTMWLDATASASRWPANPAAAALTASTAVPARIRAAVGVGDRVAAEPAHAACARGGARRARAAGGAARARGVPAARSPRASSSTPPPRKSGEAQRRRTSSSSIGTASFGRADARGTPRRGRPSRRPGRRTWRRSSSAPRRTRRRPPAFRTTRRSRARRARTHGRHRRARVSPTRSRSVGRSSQSVETKPPLRPLGPWPHRSASTTTTSASGSSSLQVPGRPHAEVAAADDEDVGADVVRSSAGSGSTGPKAAVGLLEPPAGTCVPELRHGCDPRW